jgi:hypothetical protein
MYFHSFTYDKIYQFVLTIKLRELRVSVYVMHFHKYYKYYYIRHNIYYII